MNVLYQLYVTFWCLLLTSANSCAMAHIFSTYMPMLKPFVYKGFTSSDIDSVFKNEQLLYGVVQTIFLSGYELPTLTEQLKNILYSRHNKLMP